jgi:DHA2 family multidrug resistance protein-like MFS transporter
VPGAFAFIAGSNSAPRLVRRIRPALLVAGGLLLAAVGMGMLAIIGVDSLALIVIGNTLMSLGFGVTFSLTVDMVVGTAPPDRAGAASALAETGAELGGALGLAVMGSLGTAVYRSQLATTAPAGVSPEVLATVQETLGAAAQAAGQLPEAVGAQLLIAAQWAFVHGLQLLAVIGVVGFVGLAILVATMLRHVEIHGDSEELPESEPGSTPLNLAAVDPYLEPVAALPDQS